MRNKFIMEKWISRPDIYIYDKNLQNIGLKRNINEI